MSYTTGTSNNEFVQRGERERERERERRLCQKVGHHHTHGLLQTPLYTGLSWDARGRGVWWGVRIVQVLQEGGGAEGT